ncbi:phage minor tail protein G [Erwinia papayae]|uniref:Phage minor tail protein G n=1 Tax=Erwinia papayae TaxID=206499 RepID=A0ABV3N3A1_9GAMM
MFLKKDTFTFNGGSKTLHELSALQRIELLEFLATEEKARQTLAEGEPEEVQSARFVGFNIRAGARVVAMSLWQGTDKTLSVEQLYQEVMETWPVEAIGKADMQIKVLSGMILTAAESSDSAAESEENQDKEADTDPAQKP